jgi:glycosyltransferase involved in cell wall biosynthesis
LEEILNNKRIFYLSANFQNVSGGVKTAYIHVRVLLDNGFNASIVLCGPDSHIRGADRNRYFLNSADVPELTLDENMTFHKNDIVVLPEGWGDYIKHFGATPLRTIVFCQNNYYIYRGLGNARNYEELGIDRVFCGSEFMTKSLKEQLGYENTPIVPYAINPKIYRPLEKSRQIAYMPRKMALEASFVEGEFKRLFPHFADVPWMKIDKMAEVKAAEIMGQSMVFVSFNRLDALGLPPLEAMSSGCILTGFLGGGGVEYATHENGFWCDPEDWRGAAEAVAAALEAFGTEVGANMIRHGHDTAARYSARNMKDALLRFWGHEVTL